MKAALSFLREKPVVIAVNHADSQVWADYLVSLHWECARLHKQESLNPDALFVCGKDTNSRHVDYVIPGHGSGATSSMSAVKIALFMGFDMVIMCGCPLNGGDGNVGQIRSADTARPGNADPNGKLMRKFRNAFIEELQALPRHKIRSMSGFTAETLGVFNGF